MSDAYVIHPPDEMIHEWSLVGDLRVLFPSTDGIYNGGTGEGNHTIQDEVTFRLTMEQRVGIEFDSEYSGFYAYSQSEDKLKLVASVIDRMVLEEWSKTPEV